MSVIYCFRGEHYVDTDFDGSALIDGEDVCDDCLTEKEINLRDGEDFDPEEINFDA